MNTMNTYHAQNHETGYVMKTRSSSQRMLYIIFDAMMRNYSTLVFYLIGLGDNLLMQLMLQLGSRKFGFCAKPVKSTNISTKSTVCHYDFTHFSLPKILSPYKSTN